MGSKKISELPAATTLNGTELVPIVQGGVSKAATLGRVLADLVGMPTFENGQPIPKVSRIVDPGFVFFNFSDDADALNAPSTALTLGGTTANWTKSVVSGLDGITDAGRPTQGSRTGNPVLTKISCNGSQTGSLVVSSGTISASINGKFGLWVYFSPDSTWGNQYIDVELSSTGSWSGTQKVIKFDAYQLRRGWNYLVGDVNQSIHPHGVTVSGTNDIITAPVVGFRLVFTVANGTTCDFYFDSFWTGFSRTKSKIIIGKDGSGEADLLTFKSLMDQYGWRGYLNYDVTGLSTMKLLADYRDPVTAARIDQIYADGWDVINHTVNHVTLGTVLTPSFTNAQTRYQVMAQRAHQIGNGWVRGCEFFSSGQNTMTYDQAVFVKSLGFKAIRGFRGSSHPSMYGHDNILHLGSDAFDAPNGAGAAVLQTWKDRTLAHINYGGDRWLYMHNLIGGGAADGSVATGNGIQIYSSAFALYLEWLAGYVDAGLCDVVTPTEWFYGLK